MSQIKHYRVLYEYEKDCNQKMLAMLDTVPEASHSDSRFQRAVTLADHLAACREFWLGCMDGKGTGEGTGWNEQCEFSTLRPRFAAIEPQWIAYLARLDDSRLAQEFGMDDAGEDFRLPVGVQIEQLAGHASYHRGQIALLVDQLGGEVMNTDYRAWWAERQE